MHLHGTQHSIYVSPKNITNSKIKWWKCALFVKKYFCQDFTQLNLKKNTKTMISDWLYLYGALCWSCRSRRSTSLPSRASSSGVLFSLVFMLMSALSLSNSRVSSLLFSLTMKCNGTFLNLSCLFTSVPSSSRRLIKSVWWLFTATSRAVRPFSLHTSTGTPSRNIWSIFLTSPAPAEIWKLRKRCWSVSTYEKWLDAN